VNHGSYRTASAAVAVTAPVGRGARPRGVVRCALGVLMVSLVLGCEARPAPEQAAVPEALRSSVLPAVPSAVVSRPGIDFEGRLRLVGYELSPAERVSAGDTIDLTLYWQVLQPVAATAGEPDWAPVTRLLGDHGRPLAPGTYRVTRRLASGEQAFPPAQWPVGKIIEDAQQITVPARLTTAEIAVAVAVEREWKYERPIRATGAAGAPGVERGAPDAEATGTPLAPEPTAETATMPMRLRVIGGTNLEGQAILGRLATGYAPPRRRPDGPAPDAR
jgi:hypothetical protein